MDIDRNTEAGARLAGHLENDQVAWLTTVGPDGTPHPAPVWFLWDAETALVYSEPKSLRVRNIRANRGTSLHFNCTPEGGDIVVLRGEAEIDAGAPRADQLPAYVEKYAEGIRQLGISPDVMAARYNAAIRFRPTKARSD